MKKNLLSIVIPAYNTGEYLRRTLEVLTSQSYSEYEIIIVDDNSTDDTANIVDKFLVNNINIKYIKNKRNCGPGISRNIGFSYAEGEFITFLDSDDWPDLFAYETAINAMLNNPEYNVAIWGIKNEFNNSVSSEIRLDYSKHLSICKDVALLLLCNAISLDIRISSYLGSKMFRKGFLSANNIHFDNYKFEDVEFTLKTLINSNHVLLLPNVYTHYYQREKSIVHSFDSSHIDDMFIMIKNVYDNFHSFLPNQTIGSLVEKCTKNILNYMFNSISDVHKQKEFIKTITNKITELFSIEEILDYFDIERLKHILLHS